MTQAEMAAHFCVHENSIRNWMRNPGSIKTCYITPIRRLHVELRHKIDWKEKKEMMNE